MSSLIEINNHTIQSTFNNNEENFNIIKSRSSMTYNDFFENFLIPNRPCIFDTEITKNWSSCSNWSKNNVPDFECLKRRFGTSEVPIADCNKRFYNAQHKKDMPLKDFIDYWIEYRKYNYSNTMSLLYLKDWHFIRSHSDISIYEVPKFFASDWLNEYYIANSNLNDDYMFVYMGPKGSWTPFHVDVFTSHSWSANIVGKKRWMLFPPGQENNLKNVDGDLVYDISDTVLDNNSNNNFNEKVSSKSIEIIQEAGQIIFVPSGWHHQVWNLEDTISINHNWINGCNIWKVWSSLQKEFRAVIKEIEDCKEMENWANHCQIMLKASFGMNYAQFYEFLSFIAEQRLKSVINDVPIISFKKWYLGHTHCLFDLRQIKIVLESLLKNAKANGISTLIWKDNDVEYLLDRINKQLSN